MKLTEAFRVKAGDNIALVGGGGKSHVLFKLGQELAQMKYRVLLTTTTRIFAAQIKLAPAYISFDPKIQSLNELLPQLKQVLNDYGQVLLIGPIDQQQGKAFGVSPELVDSLFKTGRFDVIINEADGSRMRPFKAPAEHEPVIPKSTTLLIPLVGLDVIGKPLNDTYVHRAELISQLSQTTIGSLITPQTVARVLRHPNGGLKAVPSTARVTPFLNKLDLVEDEIADTIAQYILEIKQQNQGRPINSVVIGAVQQIDPVQRVKNKIAAVILAAGKASRFGSPKQVALWHNKPLLSYAVDAALASQANFVIVVLGANADACQVVLKDRTVHIVNNDAWAEGQSTSLKAGLGALNQEVSAAIFLLTDQPLITSSVIDAIIARYQETLAPIVWPEFEGKRGNPVLFDKSLFSEMQQISGDVGAKPVLLAHQDDAAGVPVANPGILLDIDTPKDLERYSISAKINIGKDDFG